MHRYQKTSQVYMESFTRIYTFKMYFSGSLYSIQYQIVVQIFVELNFYYILYFNPLLLCFNQKKLKPFKRIRQTFFFVNKIKSVLKLVKYLESLINENRKVS